MEVFILVISAGQPKTWIKINKIIKLNCQKCMKVVFNKDKVKLKSNRKIYLFIAGSPTSPAKPCRQHDSTF
jgi:hypothetical protein